jgi:hypothetical protein
MTTKAELDAATEVAKNAIIQKMKEGGWESFANKVTERIEELRDIVRYTLDAAQDVREKK